MTGPRDYSAEWAAVFAGAYLERVSVVLARRGAWGDPLSEDDATQIAAYAARVADEAVKALHRVRGSEGA